MYFFGFGSRDNTNSDINTSVDTCNIVIDIDVETNSLLGEIEEIITYDDLNISHNNKIRGMKDNNPIPRPTLVIPNLPTYQNRLSDSESDLESESNNEIDNYKIEIYKAEGSNTDGSNTDGSNTDTTTTDENTILTHIPNKNVDYNRNISFYAANTILCGVFVYVFFSVSGII